jgi:hypothetical protein
MAPIQTLKRIINDLFKRHKPGRGIQPKTIEEAMKFLHETDLAQQMRGCRSMHDMPGLHHTVGMSLRNQWGLWHGSELAKYFVQVMGLTHADDMSGLLLEKLFAEVHGKPFIAGKLAFKYQSHWRQHTGETFPAVEWAKGLRAPVWTKDGYVAQYVILPLAVI